MLKVALVAGCCFILFFNNGEFLLGVCFCLKILQTSHKTERENSRLKREGKIGSDWN